MDGRRKRELEFWFAATLTQYMVKLLHHPGPFPLILILVRLAFLAQGNPRTNKSRPNAADLAILKSGEAGAQHDAGWCKISIIHSMG